jgi:hypothetical protein
MPKIHCDKEICCYTSYFILLLIRWLLLIVAIVLCIIGTNNASTIAFLIFAFIDVLMAVVYIVAFVREHKILMIAFLVINKLKRNIQLKILFFFLKIITLILSVVHLVTTSCALYYLPTPTTNQSNSLYLGGSVCIYLSLNI